MTPLKKYDLTIKSSILRSEKTGKGLDAVAAPNPHQMNRIFGFLAGDKVVVAQRPGKGGMDFNKIAGGKVYAVAADGISPVFIKGEDGKATKNQKSEDGIPLYSSSGFYMLSSKDYPALDLFEAFTLLRNKGEQVWLLTDAQLAARQKQELTDEMDLDILTSSLSEVLSDERNLLTMYDESSNKKRKRAISHKKEEAEDSGDNYTGVEFTELAVSKKDGNPFVMYCWQSEGGPIKAGVILREAEVADDKRDDGRTVTHYFTAEEALANFVASPGYAEIVRVLRAGGKIKLAFAQGHIMRTSVSLRRKVENVLNEATKTQYGDAVYILSALKGWTKGIIGLMHSMHPTFPAADYDAHHYVASCRQAEIGMNKGVGGKWSLPEGIQYTMAAELLK